MKCHSFFQRRSVNSSVNNGNIPGTIGVDSRDSEEPKSENQKPKDGDDASKKPKERDGSTKPKKGDGSTKPKKEEIPMNELE